MCWMQHWVVLLPWTLTMSSITWSDVCVIVWYSLICYLIWNNKGYLTFARTHMMSVFLLLWSLGMKAMKNVNFSNDWKMITIQIGSNDQCASCLSPWKSEVTAEKFGSYVEKAVERIQKSIPRTIVNLVGSFKVSPVYSLTKGQDYCRPILNIPDAQLNRVECSCFLGSDEDRSNMDDLADSMFKMINLV